MDAAEALRELGYSADTEGWIWHSIHAAAAQTAQIISSQHAVTLNHVIPEYRLMALQNLSFSCAWGGG